MSTRDRRPRIRGLWSRFRLSRRKRYGFTQRDGCETMRTLCGFRQRRRRFHFLLTLLSWGRRQWLRTVPRLKYALRYAPAQDCECISEIKNRTTIQNISLQILKRCRQEISDNAEVTYRCRRSRGWNETWWRHVPFVFSVPLETGHRCLFIQSTASIASNPRQPEIRDSLLKLAEYDEDLSTKCKARSVRLLTVTSRPVDLYTGISLVVVSVYIERAVKYKYKFEDIIMLVVITYYMDVMCRFK